MAKCFEFQRISTEITKEHRRLFTRLAGKSNAGRNHECNLGGFESFCQLVEFVPIEDRSKMWNGNLDSIDVTVRNIAGHFGGNVRRNLVSEKIEIDPRIGAPTLGATEQFTIEAPCGGEIDDGKGVMKWFRHDARR